MESRKMHLAAATKSQPSAVYISEVVASLVLLIAKATASVMYINNHRHHIQYIYSTYTVHLATLTHLFSNKAASHDVNSATATKLALSALQLATATKPHNM